MADQEVIHLEPAEDGDELDVQIETALTGARQEVLDELQELHEAGKLDPESVAQRAQDPDSALHSVIFSEDDSVAAWRRRVDLARRLVGRIKIVTVQVKITNVEGGGTHTARVKVGEARAFTSVQEPDGRHQYRETREALTDRRDEVVAMLDREVRAMVERRRSILSLDEIEKTITDVIEAIRAGR